MSDHWTAEDRKTLHFSRYGWVILVVLGVGAFAVLGLSLWRMTAKPHIKAEIIGEWQASDPPWHAVFRPDKTVGMTFNGTSAPETLAPLVMTPGVEVQGRFTKGPEGTFKLQLQNGKNYEATFGQYSSDRFDLTDAEGASAVITFTRVKSSAPTNEDDASR
jgi:hypothetical protein